MPATYMDRQMRAGEAMRVVIPKGWQQLAETQRCSIASRLSGMQITSAKNADALIRAALKRRG